MSRNRSPVIEGGKKCEDLALIGTSDTEYVAARAVVNLFATRSCMAEVTSQAVYGARVRVVEFARDWACVRTVDGYTGWARLEELQGVERECPAEARARVAGLSANVYAEPDVKLRMPLLTLPWESLLEVMNEDVPEHPAWVRVRLLDGAVAYVQRGDLDRAPRVVGVTEMLAVARRFLGVTYTWGGVSSFGFDCSGLVQMLFRQCGVVTPRDAQLQANWEAAMRVERERLRAGDVVFFGDTPEAITHVGVMIEEAMFLHATTEGRPGVQMSRLTDAPWESRMCAQRRFPLVGGSDVRVGW